jgi:tryptophan synthase alpha chain
MFTMKTGLQRIEEAFELAATDHAAALMPYFTLGYPDPETSLQVIQAISRYSHLIELGVPFSDPIADGPTIQRSTQLALEQGVTSRACLEMVRELRERGVDTPALLMGYYNPIIAYGEEKYVLDAAAAGADGLIIPDLPPEEAGVVAEAADHAGMALIYFLAPTSDGKRIRLVLDRAKGFIYMVSVTGVTGARATLHADLRDFVQRLREQTDVKIAVGFGIAGPEQAAKVSEYADGIIVGSALIDAVNGASDKVAAAQAFVKDLQASLSKKGH